MKNPDPRAAAARKLAALAEQLQAGACFPVTRLTVLKRLCSESQDAAAFAHYLAELAQDRFRQAPPSHLEPDRVRAFGARIDAALNCIHAYRSAPDRDAELALRAACRELESAQAETRDTRWATVRTIDSREALVVETAVHCLLEPRDSARWGYSLGRKHAERYDPRCGSGLSPASAPYVREIAEFWLAAPPHPVR
ncbi:MAG TPA: hypothetical protein VLK84_20015 [Longimicrobium sp.]|nr:hypothetical protein [Longimicrobium sp.]